MFDLNLMQSPARCLPARPSAPRRVFLAATAVAWLALSGIGTGEVLAHTSVMAEAAPAQGKPEPAKPDQAVQVKAEIVVLHATNEGKGIDPGIGPMPDLLKPPFSAYDTYKLVEKVELELPKGTAKEKALPDGGKLSVTLTDLVLGKKKADVTRYVLSATIEKPGGKKFLPGLSVNAVQGEYFFIAGQKYNGGILVVGIRIR